ncbi:hypothetical protein LT493_09845 [Streptomyces tricolor]|nr:hypothetical protein [Streptomyces tricolor]
MADPELAAALTVAAYRTVFLGSVRRLLAGDPVEEVARGSPVPAGGGVRGAGAGGGWAAETEFRAGLRA